ncbi:MAG: NAD(P)H-dependent oxidoreductase subunit E [Acidobacteria bacterium]|nr:NAD(P)H-dependent oxidoreductase subunit E [Acidobacteriota bacterium]
MEERILELLKRYPTTRATLIPVLWLCQERYGWLAPGVIRAVADRLGESPAYVEGVATFYTMFYTKPPAKFVLQACETLSCAVCGGKELLHHLESRLGIKPGEKTPDGVFQLVGVQCLGACGTAPVVQINDDYYENLTIERLDAVLDDLKGRS